MAILCCIFAIDLKLYKRIRMEKQHILDNLSHGLAKDQTYFPLPFFLEDIYHSCKKNGRDFVSSITIPIRYDMNPSIDPFRLAKAVADAVGAHACFSAALTEKEGKPYLVRSHFGVPSVPVVEADGEEEAEALIRQIQASSIKAEGPLYRFAIVSSPSKTYLVGGINHTICDGASIFSLSREVFARYDGKKVSPEEVDMYDWITFYEDFIQSDKAKDLVEEFGQLLEGFDPIVPHSEHAERASLKKQLLGKDEYTQFGQFARKTGMSAGSIFMAAYTLLLMRADGKRNCCHMTTYHRRLNGRMQQLQSCVVGRAPIAVSLPESDLVADYLTHYNERFKLLAKKYSLVHTLIEHKYAAYIDTPNINMVSVPKMEIGGTETFLELPNLSIQKHSLFVYFFFNPDGTVQLLMMSTRYDAEQLKDLFNDLRHILDSLRTVEKLSEI